MRIFVINCLVRLHKDEAGHGLYEYLLILALVAFASTAYMVFLAKGLNTALTEIAARLRFLSRSLSPIGIRLH